MQLSQILLQHFTDRIEFQYIKHTEIFHSKFTAPILSLGLVRYAPTSTLVCSLYLAVIPPSTLITPPVMKSFSNKKSTALATSAQVPSLFRGCIAAACSLVYAPPL